MAARQRRGRLHAGIVSAPRWFSPDLLYGFPAGDGVGECVAIIELGGGYRTADLQAYFAAIGISPGRMSVAVSVDHAMNLPTGDPSGPDGEVMLDIEVVGAIAPAARIVVYFAPNTDAGFLDAITTAVHDTVNRPSVISISWGGPEVVLDRTGDDGVRQCAAGGRGDGHHGLRCRGRQRLQRRRGRRGGSRGLPGLQPARAGLRRDQPDRPQTWRFPARWGGTTARRAAPAAAGSARSSPCRRGRPG